MAGSLLNVIIQQNLNHWLYTKPGFIDIAVTYDINANPLVWTTLLTFDDFPANDMVTQTNFSVQVFLPKTVAANGSNALLQVRYVSHNPDEVDPPTNTDAIFYNCADLYVSPQLPQSPDVQSHVPNTMSIKQDAPTCVTPPIWVCCARRALNSFSTPHRLSNGVNNSYGIARNEK